MYHKLLSIHLIIPTYSKNCGLNVFFLSSHQLRISAHTGHATDGWWSRPADETARFPTDQSHREVVPRNQRAARELFLLGLAHRPDAEVLRPEEHPAEVGGRRSTTTAAATGDEG